MNYLKHKLILLISFIILCIVLLLSFVFIASASNNQNDINQNNTNTIIAKYGQQGKIVKEIQTCLYNLKYLKNGIDGIYGSITKEAVKSFQLEHNLQCNGVVDLETFDLIKKSNIDCNNYFEYKVFFENDLYSISQKFDVSVASLILYNRQGIENKIIIGETIHIPKNVIYRNRRTSRGKIHVIQAIPWSIVDKLWKVGEVATVTDYETGKSFKIQRLGGIYHADVEPLTEEDMETMFEINNNEWNWKRRPVIITVNNQKIASSMNNMPHGFQNIKNNGFAGHACVHFLGSRIHTNYSVDNEHLDKITAVEIDKNEILINLNK